MIGDLVIEKTKINQSITNQSITNQSINNRQGLAGDNLVACVYGNVVYCAADRGGDLHLHFHGFEDDDDFAFLYGLT